MNTKTNGFTLIELIMTLAISIILFGVALPNFKSLVNQSKVTSNINQLSGLIQIARQTAITNKVVVTLCPSSDGLNCSKNWQQGQLLFIDINKNHIKDEEDQIISVLSALPKNHNLTWRAFQNKNYLQYAPTGLTRSQNGTFRYCVEGTDLKYNRALIISKSGRLKKSQDDNGDGIHEDSVGNEVTCD